MDFSQRRRVDPRPDTSFTAASRNGRVVGRADRAPRHAGIFEAVHRIDAHLDAATRTDLGGWIRDEYTAEFGAVPLGFVAQCHLGPPYVDHILDLVHSILEHYAPADPMPQPFGRARTLVRSSSYAFVEVYADGELRPVMADGSVVA